MTIFGETILVVDDDPYIQEALGDRLESLGYQVTRASDGKQALELIDHQDPQMVFLDIEMPGMKGLDVLREIRAREKDFPVVMVSPLTTTRYWKASLAGGIASKAPPLVKQVLISVLPSIVPW